MTQMHKYPTSFQAVDCLIFNDDCTQILLGKKPNQEKWRFIGGFVDPKDQSLEDAASRELNEEVKGIIAHRIPTYLGSFRVNDPRYENSEDKIMSAVFYVILDQWISLKGGDDIQEVKWVTFKTLDSKYKEILVPEHFPIVEKFLDLYV